MNAVTTTPEASTRYATCVLCEASCGLKISVEAGGSHQADRASRIEGNEHDVLSRGHVCPKAVALEDVRLDPDRVREPFVRDREGGQDVRRGVGWDEALSRAADGIRRIQDQHGPRAVAVYLGNPMAHNGHALLGAGVFMAALGQPTRFSATSTDQLPHMLASLEMFGHQALLPVPDVDRTSFFLCLGANPLVSNGSLMTAPGIDKRFAAMRARGGKLVVVDPRRTETARVADEHHFIRPGTDALLLMAMVSAVLEGDRARLGRLAAHTDGLDELARAARPFTPERVAPVTGIAVDVVHRLVGELVSADKAVVYGRVGVCQQEFGGLAAWLVNVLNALTGNLDREGGSMFTTPAVDLVRLGAWAGQKGSFDRYRSSVRGLPEFGGELPVACLAEEIEAGHIRGLVTIAGNPVSSGPNGERLGKALEKLETMVSVDIYRNETTRHAHVFLPTTFGLEREHFDLALSVVSVRNFARWSAPVFAPPAGVRDEWDVLSDLACRVARGVQGHVVARAARALGARRAFDLALRAGPHKLSVSALEEQPHGVDLGPLQPRFPDALHTPGKRVFLAPARFLADVPRLQATLDRAPADGELLLIGRRSLRSNNSWMHNSHRLVKGRARCTLLMHPRDAGTRGLKSGALVRLRSRVGEVRVAVEVSDDIAPGVVSLPHGWGQRGRGVELRIAGEQPGASINDVTDDLRVDALSGTAAFSGTPVQVDPAE
jgi:anaerobic selenocysteine-containing dehydrogenase